MNRIIKFSLKQKLATFRSIMSGKESPLSAGRKIGAHKETVRLWRKHYQATGVRGLKLRNGSCRGTFKLHKSYRGQQGKVTRNLLNRDFEEKKPYKK
jgi:hypothetical protein